MRKARKTTKRKTSSTPHSLLQWTCTFIPWTLKSASMDKLQTVRKGNQQPSYICTTCMSARRLFHQNPHNCNNKATELWGCPVNGTFLLPLPTTCRQYIYQQLRKAAQPDAAQSLQQTLHWSYSQQCSCLYSWENSTLTPKCGDESHIGGNFHL